MRTNDYHNDDWVDPDYGELLMKYTSSVGSDFVVYVSGRGVEYKTLKEAAIEEIKNQPFYK